mgnify:CR=1 FL=1
MQALALMNDETFVEAARSLADRILSEEETQSNRISLAWETVLSRNPDRSETSIFESTLKRAATWFAKHPKDAGKLVSTGASSPSWKDPEELAAWTTAMSVLLNLDETITLE